MLKLRGIADQGEVESVEKGLGAIRRFDQGRNHPIFPDRHRIWKLSDYARAQRGDRSDTIRENETIAAGEGFSIIANHQLDRVQIMFEAKPDEETRGKLKGEGWNVSPGKSAWQRPLTDNGIISARRITDLGGYTQREQGRREAGQGRVVA